MQLVTISTLLLVASALASASSSQQESSSASIPNQNAQIGNSPAQPPAISSVEVSQPSVAEQPSHSPAVSSYYVPSGLIQPVGEHNKPLHSYEHYGQPESASIPSNYKPFGSWGLYIGGNPADGYYNSFYKALSNSVDKQVGDVKPFNGQSGFSPILRQGGSSSYNGEYYPIAYSTSDLNVASPAVHQVIQPAAVQVQPPAVSPVQAGAQIYGSPNVFEPNYGVSSYADSYATKKLGSIAQKEVPVVHQSKGHQARYYVYPSSVPQIGQLSAPVVSGVHVAQPVVHPNQHVVAYPIPVGSQIIGSQPGVEGAFSPYGIHAFTRYAIKPAVVNQDVGYYYSTPGSHVASYKVQGVAHNQHPYQYGHYPLSYYGFPLNQLHYGQGVIVPSSYGQVGQASFGPIVPSTYGASSSQHLESDQKIEGEESVKGAQKQQN